MYKVQIQNILENEINATSQWCSEAFGHKNSVHTPLKNILKTVKCIQYDIERLLEKFAMHYLLEKVL